MEKLRNVIKNPVYLGFAVIVLLLFLLGIFLFYKNKSEDLPDIKEGQIQIVKGDETITINENGLVVYKSKDREYSEMWDTSQISSFFSMMEKKARDYISRKISGGDCGYKVFMFIDGKLVAVCIDSGDEEVADIIEPIIIRYSDLDLSDYFNNDADEKNEDVNEDVFDGITFPTSTSYPVRATATPTPYSVYNINTNYAPVKADCETWSGEIVNGRAIISNTFCVVAPTPTP